MPPIPASVLTTHQNDITITAPAEMQASLTAMRAAGCLHDFGLAWLRLFDVFSSHLSHPTPANRRRTATVWVDPKPAPNGVYDWNWLIQEAPLAGRVPAADDSKIILVGGLIYHRQENTFGIHT
jgi:hypothetical protein